MVAAFMHDLCAHALALLAVAAPTGALVPQSNHSQPITFLAASPDGALLATGARDDSIRVWDAQSDRLLRVLRFDADCQLSRLRFGEDSRSVVATMKCGDEDAKETRGVAWELDSGNFRPVEDEAAQESPLELSIKSTRYRAVGTKLYRGDRALGSPMPQAHNLYLSSDGEVLLQTLVAESVHSYRVWHLRSGRILREGVPEEQAYGFGLTPDGRRVFYSVIRGPYYQFRPKGLMFVDVASGKRSDFAATIPSESISFSPDGRWVALAGGVLNEADEARGAVVNAKTGAVVKALPGVEQVRFRNDGKQLLAGADLYDVRDWAPESAACAVDECSPDFRYAARVDGRDPKLKKVSIGPSDTAIEALPFLSLATFFIYRLGFSPSNDRIVVCAPFVRAALHDVATLARIRDLAESGDDVKDAAFTHDGRVLVTLEYDGALVLRNGVSGEPVATLLGVGNKELVIYTPDGRYFGSSPEAFYGLARREGTRAVSVDATASDPATVLARIKKLMQ
jgi:WD40 repeat protein